MPCPDDPICQRCPAAAEDDVCLTHERQAAERRDPFSLQSLGDALRPEPNAYVGALTANPITAGTLRAVHRAGKDRAFPRIEEAVDAARRRFPLAKLRVHSATDMYGVSVAVTIVRDYGGCLVHRNLPPNWTLPFDPFDPVAITTATYPG